MNDQPSSTSIDDEHEDDTVRLLRLAGPRPPVSDVRAARVREAVHRRWRTGTRRRAIRRKAFWAAGALAAAAAVILIAGRGVVVERPDFPVDQVVALVERIDGIPRRAASVTSGSTNAIARQDRIRVGEWIETDASARLALRFSSGTAVRLDAGSRVRAVSADAIELAAGAVYVDSGQTPGRFEIRTPLATARDIGTQFEVRLLGAASSADVALRLRVRTGIVELTQGARTISGRGGTEVIFSTGGTESRPLAPYGPEWEWTAGLAPPIEIEGQALSGFLARLAHEHGWDVRYADPALAQDASGIILHGSVAGLPPQQAVEVAIATSGLRHQLENGRLVVMRGSAPKKQL